MSYPLAKTLVDLRALLETFLLNHLSSHLLHVDHKRIERLFDVSLLRHCVRANHLVEALNAFGATSIRNWRADSGTVLFEFIAAAITVVTVAVENDTANIASILVTNAKVIIVVVIVAVVVVVMAVDDEIGSRTEMSIKVA